MQHGRQYPEKSVRLSQEIGVSTRPAREICRDDLSLFPHKMQLSQPMSGEGIERLRFRAGVTDTGGRQSEQIVSPDGAQEQNTLDRNTRTTKV
jgi:hypothetical protein